MTSIYDGIPRRRMEKKGPLVWSLQKLGGREDSEDANHPFVGYFCVVSVVVEAFVGCDQNSTVWYLKSEELSNKRDLLCDCPACSLSSTNWFRWEPDLGYGHGDLHAEKGKLFNCLPLSSRIFPSQQYLENSKAAYRLSLSGWQDIPTRNGGSGKNVHRIVVTWTRAENGDNQHDRAMHRKFRMWALRSACETVMWLTQALHDASNRIHDRFVGPPTYAGATGLNVFGRNHKSMLAKLAECIWNNSKSLCNLLGPDVHLGPDVDARSNRDHMSSEDDIKDLQDCLEHCQIIHRVLYETDSSLENTSWAAIAGSADKRHDKKNKTLLGEWNSICKTNANGTGFAKAREAETPLHQLLEALQAAIYTALLVQKGRQGVVGHGGGDGGEGGAGGGDGGAAWERGAIEGGNFGWEAQHGSGTFEPGQYPPPPPYDYPVDRFEGIQQESVTEFLAPPPPPERHESPLHELDMFEMVKSPPIPEENEGITSLDRERSPDAFDLPSGEKRKRGVESDEDDLEELDKRRFRLIDDSCRQMARREERAMSTSSFFSQATTNVADDTHHFATRLAELEDLSDGESEIVSMYAPTRNSLEWLESLKDTFLAFKHTSIPHLSPAEHIIIAFTMMHLNSNNGSIFDENDLDNLRQAVLTQLHFRDNNHNASFDDNASFDQHSAIFEWFNSREKSDPLRRHTEYRDFENPARECVEHWEGYGDGKRRPFDGLHVGYHRDWLTSLWGSGVEADEERNCLGEALSVMDTGSFVLMLRMKPSKAKIFMFELLLCAAVSQLEIGIPGCMDRARRRMRLLCFRRVATSSGKFIQIGSSQRELASTSGSLGPLLGGNVWSSSRVVRIAKSLRNVGRAYRNESGLPLKLSHHHDAQVFEGPCVLHLPRGGLLEAARQGVEVTSVDALIESRARSGWRDVSPALEETDTNGMTALDLACLSGSPRLVNMILNSPGGRGMFHHAQSSSSRAGSTTCLHIACMKGWEGVVRQLFMDAPSEMDSAFLLRCNERGRTAMHIAAAAGHAGVVAALIEKLGGKKEMTKFGTDGFHVLTMRTLERGALVQLQQGTLTEKAIQVLERILTGDEKALADIAIDALLTCSLSEAERDSLLRIRDGQKLFPSSKMSVINVLKRDLNNVARDALVRLLKSSLSPEAKKVVHEIMREGLKPSDRSMLCYLVQGVADPDERPSGVTRRGAIGTLASGRVISDDKTTDLIMEHLQGKAHAQARSVFRRVLGGETEMQTMMSIKALLKEKMPAGDIVRYDGEKKIMQMLVERSLSRGEHLRPNGGAGAYARSCLELAAANGHAEVVRLLLEAGIEDAMTMPESPGLLRGGWNAVWKYVEKVI